MHGPETVQKAFDLAASGLTQAEIARALGIGPTTVSRWLGRGRQAVLGSPMRSRATDGCPARCAVVDDVPPAPYAYLLGQYLGDGTIVLTRRNVHRLFVSCCAAYPGIVEECVQAIRAVLPDNLVGRRARTGVVEVSCYSTHLPCLFPQHGPGKKHSRPIVLAPWQAALALDTHPDRFVRGLIHSDGCRSTNRVRGRNGRSYEYVRYQFCNRSDDIRGLFCEACDRLGVEWRRMNAVTISVARSASVSRLEAIVGPKA
ncbi:MAG TPA: sigma factor-like helix-turn-helix DNA-binding protein [Acidimicrobiales bacterium]|nr:sigma factor-like helix-turn-helix DNA-binding protein [Acidimicrobiales bacterium]